MKTIYSIKALLLLLLISTNSFSAGATPTNPLIGKWDSKSITLSECNLAASNGVTNCSNTSEPQCGVLTYTATSYTTTDGGSIATSGTYTIEGNTMTTTESDVTQELTFKVEDETLTLSRKDEETGCIFVQTYERSK